MLLNQASAKKKQQRRVAEELCHCIVEEAQHKDLAHIHKLLPGGGYLNPKPEKKLINPKPSPLNPHSLLPGFLGFHSATGGRSGLASRGGTAQRPRAERPRGGRS